MTQTPGPAVPAAKGVGASRHGAGASSAPAAGPDALLDELLARLHHAGTGLRLVMSRSAPDRGRVAVVDWAPRAAVQVRPSSRTAAGGRGLFLVDHLADGWGSAADETRKTVWFELQP